MTTGYINPGRVLTPLVVNPVIRQIRLDKVLIDGGSALNIIFAKTLEDMGFDMTKLVPSD